MFLTASSDEKLGISRGPAYTIETSTLYNKPKINRYYKTLKPYYKLKNADDTTLVFESRFESGNLSHAIKRSDFEYDLSVKPDYNTHGFQNWFFFSISNIKAKTRYRLNIVNLQKGETLYTSGMKPLFYSTQKAKYQKIGWYRSG